MRTFLSMMVVFFLLLSSCGDLSHQSNSVKNNSYDKPDTVGFYQARDLKGLANFKINESTYKETLDVLKSESKQDKRYNSFLFNLSEITFDTIKSFLNEDILERNIFGCPHLSAIKVSSYFIGDIEVSELKLTFYQDTLIRIDCLHNDEIDEGFTLKYGKGKLINNSLWKTPNGETNERPKEELISKSQLLKIDEKKIWENINVIATSVFYCKYKYDGDKYLGADMSTSYQYFSIVSKDINRNYKMNKCDSIAQRYKDMLNETKKRKDLEKL